MSEIPGLERISNNIVKRKKDSKDVIVKEKDVDIDKKIEGKLAAEIKAFQESRSTFYPYAEKEIPPELEAEKNEFYKRRAAEKINN